MLRISAWSAAFVVAAATAAWAQKPERPQTGARETGRWYDGTRDNLNCYCCNTGLIRTNCTTSSQTFLMEFSSVCDALCAECPVDHCKNGHQQPRDGGKGGDHSLEVTLEAAIEHFGKLAGEANLPIGKGSAKAKMEESLKSEVGASGKVTLGAKNTHASPCEKLDFYGYIAVTIEWQTENYTFTYCGCSVYDTSAVYLNGVTVTIKNGYDKTPCKCTMSTACHTPDGEGTYVCTTTVTVAPGLYEPVNFPTEGSVSVDSPGEPKDVTVAAAGVGAAAGIGAILYKLRSSSDRNDHTNASPIGDETRKQVYPNQPAAFTVPEEYDFVYVEGLVDGKKVATEAPAVLRNVETSEKVAIHPKTPEKIAASKTLRTTPMKDDLTAGRTGTVQNGKLQVVITPSKLTRDMTAKVRAVVDNPNAVDPEAFYEIRLAIRGPEVCFLPEGTLRIERVRGRILQSGYETMVQGQKDGTATILGYYAEMTQ